MAGGHHRLDMEAHGNGISYCALCSGTFKGKVPHHCGEVYLCKEKKHSIQELQDAGLLDAARPTAKADAKQDVDKSNDEDDSDVKHQKVSCWTLWHEHLDVKAIHEYLFEKGKQAKQRKWREEALNSAKGTVIIYITFTVHENRRLKSHSIYIAT